MSYKALIIVLLAILIAFIGCAAKNKEVEKPVYGVPDAAQEWFDDADLDDLPEAGRDSGDADEDN